MDLEHRDLMIRTRELIEATRREILELRQEIQLAQDTIDQSQKLLSRTEPTSQSARASRPKPLNLVRFGLI
jgi:hypothetical protein